MFKYLYLTWRGHKADWRKNIEIHRRQLYTTFRIDQRLTYKQMLFALLQPTIFCSLCFFFLQKNIWSYVWKRTRSFLPVIPLSSHFTTSAWVFSNVVSRNCELLQPLLFFIPEAILCPTTKTRDAMANIPPLCKNLLSR